MISFRALDKDTAAFFNSIGNRYLAEEQLTLLYNGSSFSLSYIRLSEPQWRSYPPDICYSANRLMKQDAAACFFAFWADQPAGQAIVTKQWNHLAMLYDIRVDEKYRAKALAVRCWMHVRTGRKSKTSAVWLPKHSYPILRPVNSISIPASYWAALTGFSIRQSPLLTENGKCGRTAHCSFIFRLANSDKRKSA